MKYDHHITAQVIGILRAQKGLSQESLAVRAGLARSHYAMIESGAKSPNVETLWRIAGALDMRLSMLIGLVEEQLSHERPLKE